MKDSIGLLVILSFFALSSIAQDYTKSKFITVRGRVESVSGESLQFATIRVRNTRLGTATDKSGNFSLDVPVQSKLTVSSVGYLQEEVTINNNNYIVVLLKKSQRIDSVIITSPSNIDLNPQLIRQRFRDYKDDDRIFTVIEVSAQFPGGSHKFKDYLIKNLNYPDSSLVSGVNGSLALKFTVGKEGYLKNIRIIKGLDKFCDSLVLHVFRNSPQWFPAIQNGNKVEEDLDFSIRFSNIGLSESKVETRKINTEPKVDNAPKEETVNTIYEKYSKVKMSSKEFDYASKLVENITDTVVLNLYFDSLIYKKFKPVLLKEREKYDKAKAKFYEENLSEFRRILSNYFAASYTVEEIRYLIKMYSGKIGRSIAFKQLVASSEIEYFYLESFMKSVGK